MLLSPSCLRTSPISPLFLEVSSTLQFSDLCSLSWQRDTEKINKSTSDALSIKTSCNKEDYHLPDFPRSHSDKATKWTLISTLDAASTYTIPTRRRTPFNRSWLCSSHSALTYLTLPGNPTNLSSSPSLLQLSLTFLKMPKSLKYLF
jgi:hypothetical protein